MRLSRQHMNDVSADGFDAATVRNDAGQNLRDLPVKTGRNAECRQRVDDRRRQTGWRTACVNKRDLFISLFFLKALQ